MLGECSTNLNITIIYNNRGLEGHHAACNRKWGLTAVRVSEDRTESHYNLSCSKATLS